MKELKTPQAIRVFVRDATKVASIMSSTVPPGKTQIVFLFVNTGNGHISMWCREEDKTSLVLGLSHGEAFSSMCWQIRGQRQQQTRF